MESDLSSPSPFVLTSWNRYSRALPETTTCTFIQSSWPGGALQGTQWWSRLPFVFFCCHSRETCKNPPKRVVFPAPPTSRLSFNWFGPVQISWVGRSTSGGAALRGTPGQMTCTPPHFYPKYEVWSNINFLTEDPLRAILIQKKPTVLEKHKIKWNLLHDFGLICGEKKTGSPTHQNILESVVVCIWKYQCEAFLYIYRILEV